MAWIHTAAWASVRRLVAVAIVVVSSHVAPSTVEAASARVVAGRTSAAVARAVKAKLQRIAVLDRASHRRAATRVLAAPRKVFRYVSSGRAASAVKGGFARMTHFTVRATRGRPLSAAHARQRYGLPATPSQRLTVTLPKGTPVKSPKVHGGAPGVGEVVTTRSIPRGAAEVRAVPIK